MTRKQKASLRRRIVIVVLLLTVPVVLPMFTLHRAKARVLSLLQAGLGRGVTADAVHLVLIPWPGVELEQVALADDPNYSAEPVVIATSARATLRLRSLLRGKVAFSGVHLDQPSINLTRNDQGRWNFAAFLDEPPTGQAVGKGLAPGSFTSNPSAGRGRAQLLTAIDWSDARVNFKLNNTKTRFYLSQVRGSLVHDGGGWRLQVHFQPQRSDLILSNTGDVSLSGRWTPGEFRQSRFDVQVQVANSYLAGSSALFAGHDAGVHGILSAQVHAWGTAAAIHLDGKFRAESLRRWDLLPPPAEMSGVFQAVYSPVGERLAIVGAGDPGFQHLQLSGEVDSLFAHPAGSLELRMRTFPAADLLPVIRALKANLPNDLQAKGTADGDAELDWSGRDVGGTGRFNLQQFSLSAGNDKLDFSTVTFDWNGHKFAAEPVTASVRFADSKRAVPVRLAADLNRDGFALHLSGAQFGPGAAGALAHLTGTPSVWPARLTGDARIHLDLVSNWQSFRTAGWTGEADIAQGSFQSPGETAIPLRGVQAILSDPNPMHVNFAAMAGEEPIRGWVEIPWHVAHGIASDRPAPIRFDMHAASLRGEVAVKLLSGHSEALMARVLGGNSAAWASRLFTEGTIAIGDLEWQGTHAQISAQVSSRNGVWKFPVIRVKIAQGRFDGSGRLEQDRYWAEGQVTNVHLDDLLADTPYAGAMSGVFTGPIQVTRPIKGTIAQLEASGSGTLRNGKIADTAFDRLWTAFHLRNGALQLSQVEFASASHRYHGAGEARLDRGLTLDLQDGTSLQNSADPPAGSVPDPRPAVASVHLEATFATGPQTPAAAFQQSLDRIQKYAGSQGPYSDVMLTADQANAWLAGPGSTHLPEGVSDLRLSNLGDMITGRATVDFDQLAAGHGSNPLLSLFSGKHQIVAHARVDSATAPSARMTVTDVGLDGSELPNTLIDLALRVFVQPKHPEISRSFSVALPAHATSAVVLPGRVILRYPK